MYKIIDRLLSSVDILEMTGELKPKSVHAIQPADYLGLHIKSIVLPLVWDTPWLLVRKNGLIFNHYIRMWP